MPASGGPATRYGPYGDAQLMRHRLLDGFAEGLEDADLLEMLLSFAPDSGDKMPIARRLIERFGSYGGVISATTCDLEEVGGVTRTAIAAVHLVRESCVRLAKAEVRKGVILNDYSPLIAYLNTVMLHEHVESLRVIFLDTKNHLIADELHGRGTVNHTPVYSREVARRGLELHATSVILVHNHPSGDPEPSADDVQVTLKVALALAAVSIRLHDHIIMGNSTWLSLRNEGLLWSRS